jgi:hypothetical protein
MDEDGNLYILESWRLLKVDAVTGIIQTVTNSGFGNAGGVVVDDSGNIYIADRTNSRVVSLSSDQLAGSGNGTGTTALASDFNGDNAVNFDDFLAFAGAFGSRQEDAGFDDKFDLNDDGPVDFEDFLEFAGDFGKTA